MSKRWCDTLTMICVRQRICLELKVRRISESSRTLSGNLFRRMKNSDSGSRIRCTWLRQTKERMCSIKTARNCIMSRQEPLTISWTPWKRKRVLENESFSNLRARINWKADRDQRMAVPCNQHPKHLPIKSQWLFFKRIYTIQMPAHSTAKALTSANK